MKDPLFIQQIISRLKEAHEKVEAEFSRLSFNQLNWKPSADKWSIAQCLDHLVVADSLYFSVFERIAAGQNKMSWWERRSPFSNFFGKFFIRHLQENPKRKMKTTPVFFPASGSIDAGIMQRFYSHLDKMIKLIDGCRDADLDKTIISSPQTRFITYSLRDVFTFLTSHLHRHIGQAMRVKAVVGFPAA